MARSTQTSPSPRFGRVTRSTQRRPTYTIVISDSEDDSSAIMSVEDTTEDLLAETSLPSSVAHSDDERIMDEDPVGEDQAYLRDLAQAAKTATQSAAEAEFSSSLGSCRIVGGDTPKHVRAFYAAILDPINRSDLRMKGYGDFVPPNMRHSTHVPKKVSKKFVSKRAKAFVDVFNLYKITTKLQGDHTHLLYTFESFLSDLMDCFDHPQEAIGWNPFAALADFVEAGAVVRSPGVVRSCSRLTLGADWGLLSQEDERRISATLLLRLHRLHHWRIAEVDEIIARWADKFRHESTCKTCNTDPWELFLLTTLVSLKKEGTRYIDVESASDTSSESSVDSDEDGDQDRDQDDHSERDSDVSIEDVDNDNIDPRLISVCMPLDDSEEPPRTATSGLAPRQRSLHNYGPNAYILRIVSMDEFGYVCWDKRHMTICPCCGYRFDGKPPASNSLFARDIERAVRVAREQFSRLQQVIDF